MLEKTFEIPLGCKEIQPVHSKGDGPWVFFGRNDAKAETPVLWPLKKIDPVPGAPSLPAESILMTVYFSGLSADCCLCHLNFNFLIYSPDKTEWSRIWTALYIGLALSSVKFGALQTYSSDYLLRTSRAISISAAG